jgi:hypothetical protein
MGLFDSDGVGGFDRDILDSLKDMLKRCNMLVKHFRMI